MTPIQRWMIVLISMTVQGQDMEKWNRKYDTENYIFGEQPIAFLKEHIDLLPGGRALDLAMGEGRNGVFLAQQGYQVLGLDISAVGLKKAHALAEKRGVHIETKVVDLTDVQLEDQAYDVIVCSYYLDRSLFPKIKAALKVGGMVVIETHTEGFTKYRDFNPEWLLATNELLQVFTDFRILRYQDVDNGRSAYASLIAQRLR